MWSWKQTIGGKVYNTETAVLIACDPNSKIYLYRTKRGDFFMHRIKDRGLEKNQIEPISAQMAREKYMLMPVKADTRLHGKVSIPHR